MNTRAVLLLLLCALVGSNAKFICRSRSCGLLNTTFLDEASNIQFEPFIELTAFPDTVVVSCSELQCSAVQWCCFTTILKSVMVGWSWVGKMQVPYQY
jgi:hypothetical protein